jgi:GNAT superfamily N-acetyltransferase
MTPASSVLRTALSIRQRPASASDRQLRPSARGRNEPKFLGRLAIHTDHQRKGIGTQLALDAFEKTLEAAKYSGIAAILLHVDEQAALEFWMSLDFKSSQDNPKIGVDQKSLALHLPIETVRQALLAH